MTAAVTSSPDPVPACSARALGRMLDVPVAHPGFAARRRGWAAAGRARPGPRGPVVVLASAWSLRGCRPPLRRSARLVRLAGDRSVDVPLYRQQRACGPPALAIVAEAAAATAAAEALRGCGLPGGSDSGRPGYAPVSGVAVCGFCEGHLRRGTPRFCPRVGR